MRAHPMHAHPCMLHYADRQVSKDALLSVALGVSFGFIFTFLIGSLEASAALWLPLLSVLLIWEGMRIWHKMRLRADMVRRGCCGLLRPIYTRGRDRGT